MSHQPSGLREFVKRSAWITYIMCINAVATIIWNAHNKIQFACCCIRSSDWICTTTNIFDDSNGWIIVVEASRWMCNIPIVYKNACVRARASSTWSRVFLMWSKFASNSISNWHLGHIIRVWNVPDLSLNIC